MLKVKREEDLSKLQRMQVVLIEIETAFIYLNPSFLTILYILDVNECH